MSDTHLSQQEANSLIDLPKVYTANDRLTFPSRGDKLVFEVTSEDEHESFMIDVNRANIALSKVANQLRTRTTIQLVRLDLGGPPHRNPDGVEIPCPHLHVYREGYGIKWAIPAPKSAFPNLADIYQAFDAFMSYCNVIAKPTLDNSLF